MYAVRSVVVKKKFSSTKNFSKNYSLKYSVIDLDHNEIEEIKRRRFGEEFQKFKNEFEKPIVKIYKELKDPEVPQKKKSYEGLLTSYYKMQEDLASIQLQDNFLKYDDEIIDTVHNALTMETSKIQPTERWISDGLNPPDYINKNASGDDVDMLEFLDLAPQEFVAEMYPTQTEEIKSNVEEIGNDPEFIAESEQNLKEMVEQLEIIQEREDEDDGFVMRRNFGDEILDMARVELDRDVVGTARWDWLDGSTDADRQWRESVFKTMAEGHALYSSHDMFRGDTRNAEPVFVGQDVGIKDAMVPVAAGYYAEHDLWEWETSLSWETQLRIMVRDLMYNGFDVDMTDETAPEDEGKKVHKKWMEQISATEKRESTDVYSFPKIKKSTIDMLKDLREKKPRSDQSIWRDDSTQQNHPLVFKNKPYRKEKTSEPITYIDDEHPLMFMHTTLFDDSFANTEGIEEETKKVIFKLKVSALKLPEPVLERFIAIAEGRYDPETDIFTIPAKQKTSKEDNRAYCLKVLRSILNESWMADLNYIPIETVDPHIQIEDELQVQEQERLRKEKYSASSLDFSTYTLFRFQSIPPRDQYEEKQKQIRNLLQSVKINH